MSGSFINWDSIRKMMQKGDFVTINYAASIKETHKVFDTTIEEVAKSEGIHTEDAVYGPVTIVLGAGHVIPGLEKTLLDMDTNSEKEIDIEPEEAFGRRDPSLVVTIPLREFKKHRVLPRAGMRIEINSKWATVRNVSSGRVTLDFNHPLSGKAIHYWVQLLERVDNTKEQIEALLHLLRLKAKVVPEEEGFSIKIAELAKGKEKETQEAVKKEIEKYIPDAKISFSVT